MCKTYNAKVLLEVEIFVDDIMATDLADAKYKAYVRAKELLDKGMYDNMINDEALMTELEGE